MTPRSPARTLRKVPHFSLVVIGSGSGNIVASAHRPGGSVALIESGAFGGTCINRGCIPSKILIHTADVTAQIRGSADFGIDAELTKMDWPAIRDRVFSTTDEISAAGRHSQAESDHVTLIEGRARFTGPHALAIDDGTTITADRIVLATGACSVIPPPIAESGVSYHTSDTVMRLPGLPASMVIVGGGYIAAELAHLFSSLGVSIRIVNQAETLLESFDPEISSRFTALASDRWDVLVSAEVTGARQRGDQIEVEVSGGSPVTGELLLVAAGRTPDTTDLDLTGQVSGCASPRHYTPPRPAPSRRHQRTPKARPAPGAPRRPAGYSSSPWPPAAPDAAGLRERSDLRERFDVLYRGCLIRKPSKRPTETRSLGSRQLQQNRNAERLH